MHTKVKVSLRINAVSCEQSISSTMFGRWHQRCGLSLSILQQLVNVNSGRVYTGCAQITAHQTHGHNSVKSEPIFKIRSLSLKDSPDTCT